MKKLLIGILLCLGLTACCRRPCGDVCPPCDPCPQTQTYCPECREYHDPEPPVAVRRGVQRQPVRQQVYSDDMMMDTTMVQRTPQPRRAAVVATDQRVQETRSKAQAQARAKEQTTPQMTTSQPTPAPRVMNGAPR